MWLSNQSVGDWIEYSQNSYVEALATQDPNLGQYLEMRLLEKVLNLKWGQ